MVDTKWAGGAVCGGHEVGGGAQEWEVCLVCYTGGAQSGNAPDGGGAVGKMTGCVGGDRRVGLFGVGSKELEERVVERRVAGSVGWFGKRWC